MGILSKGIHFGITQKEMSWIYPHQIHEECVRLGKIE